MSQSYWKAASSKTVSDYKSLAERITGPLARRLIEQTGVLQAKQTPLVVLDNACGTGVVSHELFNLLDDSAKENLDLTCGDLSEGMVSSIQERITANGWKGAKSQIVDAQNTGLPSNNFTHVITSFGVMLMPEPIAALEECFRILKPGGVCGISTWESVGWYTDFRAAMATIEGAPALPDDKTFIAATGKGAWNQPLYVKEQLEARGFQTVEVNKASGFPRMDSPAEYTEGFLSMVPFMVSKFWSSEELERLRPMIKPAMLKYMTEKYGEGKEFEFEMKAIIATGRKP